MKQEVEIKEETTSGDDVSAFIQNEDLNVSPDVSSPTEVKTSKRCFVPNCVNLDMTKAVALPSNPNVRNHWLSALGIETSSHSKTEYATAFVCRLCSSFVHKKLLNQLDKIRSIHRFKSSQRPVQDTDPLEEITDHPEIEIKEENLSGNEISTAEEAEETKSDKQLLVASMSSVVSKQNGV